jgi:hypothetical protein
MLNVCKCPHGLYCRSCKFSIHFYGFHAVAAAATSSRTLAEFVRNLSNLLLDFFRKLLILGVRGCFVIQNLLSDDFQDVVPDFERKRLAGVGAVGAF